MWANDVKRTTLSDAVRKVRWLHNYFSAIDDSLLAQFNAKTTRQIDTAIERIPKDRRQNFYFVPTNREKMRIRFVENSFASDIRNKIKFSIGMRATLAVNVSYKNIGVMCDRILIGQASLGRRWCSSFITIGAHIQCICVDDKD